MSKQILDVSCGAKRFYFDKGNNLVHFNELHPREENPPDTNFDFTDIPFPDASFYHVVFDPPHLKETEIKSKTALDYGFLPKENWQEVLKKGFSECWRVLKPGGTLNFKWSTRDYKVSVLIDLFSDIATPVYGTKIRHSKNSTSLWITYFKEVEND
jgi:tRNA G10  N-methylase Trm11